MVPFLVYVLSSISTFEACGTAEMRTWIMQWGDMVEVLEPDWLREEIRKSAQKILDIYSK
jgi:proteasome accessory factor B